MQNEFRYESPHWTSKDTYAIQNGLEGLTEKETKLASYWNTRFNKLCLGMKVNNVTKWIEVHFQATSLFEVISNETFQSTTAGKDKWKSLIHESSLQNNCNKEGFNLFPNTYMKTRIGLIANNEENCDTPDTGIGFGLSTGFSCGNWNRHRGGVTAFGFVLINA